MRGGVQYRHTLDSRSARFGVMSFLRLRRSFAHDRRTASQYHQGGSDELPRSGSRGCGCRGSNSTVDAQRRGGARPIGESDREIGRRSRNRVSRRERCSPQGENPAALHRPRAVTGPLCGYVGHPYLGRSHSDRVRRGVRRRNRYSIPVCFRNDARRCRVFRNGPTRICQETPKGGLRRFRRRRLNCPLTATTANAANPPPKLFRLIRRSRHPKRPKVRTCPRVVALNTWLITLTDTRTSCS